MLRTTQHSGFDFRDLRCLVVDDEEFSLSVLRQTLQNLGCVGVMGAESGADALDTLEIAPTSVDVILADYGMPDMNGLELLKKIRVGTIGVARDIAFVMLTGKADQFLVSTAFELDVDAFVVKPVSADKLRSRLIALMTSYRRIKPPVDYAQVELSKEVREQAAVKPSEDLLNKLLDEKPADGEVKVVKRADGSSVRITACQLQDLRDGDVLGADVKTPTGDRLMVAGDKFDPARIDRLLQVVEMGEIEDMVWIELGPAR